MGDLVLKGATSGQITVTPTAIAGTNTLTLPARTGNIITSADSGTVTSGMLASGAITRGALPAGTILQVVTATTTTQTISNSTTFVAATNITASITPTSASSRVAVFINTSILPTGGVASFCTIYRNGANILSTNGQQTFYTATGGAIWFSVALSYVDSPATTSSTTYALFFKNGSASNASVCDTSTASITLLEIAA